MNPIAIAQYGLIAATNRFSESAQRVSKMSIEGADIDLVREVVDMNLAKAGVAANAAVIRTADQMQGVVLDILA
ncbi:MAG: hypothetical protein RL588_1967 [Pseudomonadota bacterium]|jgi:flagellar hook protein FlgE